MNLIRVAAVAGLVLGVGDAWCGGSRSRLRRPGLRRYRNGAWRRRFYERAAVVSVAPPIRQDSVLGGLSPDASVGYANVVPGSVDRSFPGSGAETHGARGRSVAGRTLAVRLGFPRPVLAGPPQWHRRRWHAAALSPG